MRRDQHIKHYIWNAALLGGALLLTSCSTAPKSNLSAERIAQAYVEVSSVLYNRISKKIRIRKDVEVEVYLRRMARYLAQSRPEIAQAPLGVYLVRPSNRLWKTLSLPDGRLFLPVTLVKEFEFENEVAAIVALELAHVIHRHVTTRYVEALQEGRSPSQLLPSLSVDPSEYRQSGVFDFNDEQWKQAIKTANMLLYSARYDPRGLISYFDKHLKNIKRSPFTRQELEKYLEYAYRAYTELTPLRNPVVRSEEFAAVHKRIEKL